MLSFRLQELLDEQGIKLFPGDDRQLLMVLRAANSDPELAVEVAKKYISFSRYVLDSKPHVPNYTTKKTTKRHIDFPENQVPFSGESQVSHS